MAEQDRQRWNARFAEREPDFTPARSLVALGPRLRPTRPGARALDLACGLGRNALYLAELGYRVDAWDISDRALALLGAELDRRAAAGRPLPVSPRRVDLDHAALPRSAYDLVLDYYFLDRALFESLAAALRPGGLLVFETAVDLGWGAEHVKHPAHRLQSGELGRAFAGLEVLEYVEDERAGVARLLARRGSWEMGDGSSGGGEPPAPNSHLPTPR